MTYPMKALAFDQREQIRGQPLGIVALMTLTTPRTHPAARPTSALSRDVLPRPAAGHAGCTQYLRSLRFGRRGARVSWLVRQLTWRSCSPLLPAPRPYRHPQAATCANPPRARVRVFPRHALAQAFLRQPDTGLPVLGHPHQRCAGALEGHAGQRLPHLLEEAFGDPPWPVTRACLRLRSSSSRARSVRACCWVAPGRLRRSGWTSSGWTASSSPAPQSDAWSQIGRAGRVGP